MGDARATLPVAVVGAVVAEGRMIWTFTVLGRPVGKQRPRVTGRGTFTPSETLDYERQVFSAALAAGVRAGSGPVAVNVRIWPPSRRGDVDNWLKSVLDGLARAPVLDGDDWTRVRRASAEVVAVDARQPRVDVTVTMLEVER